MDSEEDNKTACNGISVLFQDGQSYHTAYPFGLHAKLQLLWNYHSIDNVFYIQSRSCKSALVQSGSSCRDCMALTQNDAFVSICDRIYHGVHPNTPLIYHSIGGLIAVARHRLDQVQNLKLLHLNDSRKLIGKVAALEDHKQWVMAVASGRVDRVVALTRAVLSHGGSIHTLVTQYERAAEKVYRPKGYTQDEILKSLALLRLGGVRVAEFAHHALSLPSLSTMRRNTAMRPLLVSVA